MQKITKQYLQDLENLKTYSETLANTPMIARAKITALILLNMRCEKMVLDRNLQTHPYDLAKSFIKDTHALLLWWSDVAFIEDKINPVLCRNTASMEDAHQELFQKLWVKFSPDEYQQRIERYTYRLKINDLDKAWLNGKKCIDFGCGHGNFLHALINEGAAFGYGLDFGKNSIEYATRARNALGVSPEKIQFKLESVYDVDQPDESFDFAIQNGVFHHLADEDTAIKEVHRILKVGGWFWYYTDGIGGITHDLWDASVSILRNIPREFTIAYLEQIGIETGKRYHLGDGLNAVYRHTSWNEITERLSSLGFGNFRRLKGGFSTDFDPDIIDADKYGKEKYGEGDLRLLAQKL